MLGGAGVEMAAGEEPATGMPRASHSDESTLVTDVQPIQTIFTGALLDNPVISP